MKNNQLIISGASGMLGSHLSLHFAQLGVQVFGIARSINRIPNHTNIIKCKADIREIDDLLNITLPTDCPIIHCAATVSFHAKDALLLRQVNVKGTSNMVNLALHLHSSRFIHISSSAAIGKAKLGPSTIDTERNFEEFTRYGKSKYEAEMEVMRGQAEGLSICILNPGIFVGKYFPGNPTSALVQLVQKNNPYYTEAFTLYTDIQDITNAIDYSLKSKDSPFDQAIIGGFHASNREIQQLMASYLKKKGPRKPASKQLLKVLNFFQWWVELFGGKPIQITKEIISQSQSSQEFDNQSILQFLPEFSYTSKSESIQATISDLTAKA